MTPDERSEEVIRLYLEAAHAHQLAATCAWRAFKWFLIAAGAYWAVRLVLDSVAWALLAWLPLIVVGAWWMFMALRFGGVGKRLSAGARAMADGRIG